MTPHPLTRAFVRLLVDGDAHTTRADTDWVCDVAVSASAIATGSSDTTVRVWAADGGRVRHVLQHPDVVLTVRLHADILGARAMRRSPIEAP